MTMDQTTLSWHNRALTALRQLAVEAEAFTADDLLERVGHPDTGHSANGANNAIGAVFHEAKVRGIIEPTGTYRRSCQAKRKGGLVLVWRGRHDQGVLL